MIRNNKNKFYFLAVVSLATSFVFFLYNFSSASTENSGLSITATVASTTTPPCVGCGGGEGGETAVCGNSIVETGEACDDGNRNDGDGCNSACQTESQGALTIDQITAQANCSSVQIGWRTVQAPNNISVSTVGSIVYWLSASPNNKTEIAITNAQASHLVTLNNLELQSAYTFLIKANANALNAESPTNTFRTDCLMPNAETSARPVNKGSVIDLTYPNYSDIAGVTIYKGRTTCPSANEKVYQSATAKAAGISESINAESSIALRTKVEYTVCLNNSFGVYSSGAYAETMRNIPEIGDFSAVGGNKQVTLNWTNPANNPAIDFIFGLARLIRVTVNDCSKAGLLNGVLLSTNKNKSFTDTGLNNNQVYNYKIFTRSGYAEYSLGTCLSVKTAVQAEAKCPSNFLAESGDKQVRLSWTNPENDFNFEKITLRKSDSCVSSIGAGSPSYSGSASSFTDTGLNNNQVYSYSLFTIYDGGKSLSCGCAVSIPLGQEEKTTTTDEIIPKLEEKPKELCETCGATAVETKADFLTNNGNLAINPDSQDVLNVLEGNDLIASVPRDSLIKPVSVIGLQVAGKTYFLSLSNQSNNYLGSITVNKNLDGYSLYVSTVYQDKTEAVRSWKLKVLPLGRVYDRKTNQPLAGVKISLYRVESGGAVLVNDALSSNANGLYGAMVPNGQYFISASKDDYETLKTASFNVNNKVINFNIGLEASPIIKIEEILNSKNLGDLTSSLAPLIANPGKTAQLIKDQVIDNPEVQKANSSYVAPGVAAVTLVSTATATPWWNFWYFFQYFFTEPFAWFTRKKRKGWGVIYNSLTKMPIDLAVVRIYDLKTDKLLQSRVTDHQGRYIFLVGPGEYRVEVIKRGFEFPSKIMANAKEDSKFADLYHGGKITVMENSTGAIVANIPVDQEDKKVTDKEIIKENNKVKWRKRVILIGPTIGLISFLITPRYHTFGLLVLHIALYFLFKRLADKKVPSSWGVVYDEKTGKPLPYAVARIFAPEYDRMLESFVTDKKGRYGFLVGNSVYYLTAEKPGYDQYKSNNIDLTKRGHDEVIKQDILLKKGGQPAELPALDKSESSLEVKKEAEQEISSTPLVESREEVKEQAPEIKKEIEETVKINSVKSGKKVAKEDIFG